MPLRDEEARQIAAEEAAETQHYLALYDAGQYRKLCEEYCHESWDPGWWAGDERTTDQVEEAGICSFKVSGCTEEAALRWVATHIRLQVLQGLLGC